MEPIGPESDTRPLDKNFNSQVRQLCDQYGALLIFDEVVTAFRLGMGGAQGFFNVIPDLTVLGKIIAGGYPSAGGLGGKREYMEYLAAGIQSGSKKALVGGTMLFHIPWSRPWKIPGTIKEIHARKHVMEQMGAAYMAEGIVTLAGARIMPCPTQKK